MMRVIRLMCFMMALPDEQHDFVYRLTTSTVFGDIFVIRFMHLQVGEHVGHDILNLM